MCIIGTLARIRAEAKASFDLLVRMFRCHSQVGSTDADLVCTSALMDPRCRSVGTAFAVNLLGDWKGDSAEISLDGQVVQTLSTYTTTSVYSVCVPITFNHGPFQDGRHTLTVTQRILKTDYNVGNVFLSSFA